MFEALDGTGAGAPTRSDVLTIATTRRGWLALGVAAGAAGLASGLPSAALAAADPAAQQIEALNAALLETMKSAKTASAHDRFRKLEPVVARAFDFATMTRFAVGPTWSSIPAPQQQQLIDALQRLTVASYVHNFDGWSGQSFNIDPNVVSRPPDKVVTTHLISPGDAPTPIAYRMRQAGGGWRIVDVFYNGAISQLATRRSDFAGTLASGGAPALLAHINALVDKQMK
jgi:phospholipid transport system substrate-binding protein